MGRRQRHAVSKVGIEAPGGGQTVIAGPVDFAVVIGVYQHLLHSVQAPGSLVGSPVTLLSDGPDMRRRLAVIVSGVFHILHFVAETHQGISREIRAVDVVLVAVLVHQDVLVGLPSVAGRSATVLIRLDRIHPNGTLQTVFAQPLEVITCRIKLRAALVRPVMEISFLVCFAQVRSFHICFDAIRLKDAVIFTSGDAPHFSGNSTVADSNPLCFCSGGPGRGRDSATNNFREGHGGDRHIGDFSECVGILGTALGLDRSSNVSIAVDDLTFSGAFR